MVTQGHKDYSDPDAKTNGNRIVDPGESVYLFFGLRRGGQSYYALDVTDRTAPKLLWEKHGNYPIDFPNRPTVSPGYENLGQSWSRLEPGLIKWQGKPKTVLFASGGYDPIEDGNLAEGTHRTGPLSRIEHSMGTTLYIIDAKTGEVLWDAKKHSNMSNQLTSSFPASPAPVDIDGDSFADAIFASDVGGRIWRFDLDNDAKSSDSLAKGRIIADLNSGSGFGNRRFYNEVDVIGRPDKEQILLSIGSGNRSHPATSSTAAHNHQFIIQDSLVSPEKAPAPVTLSDLGMFPEYSDKGWYFPLNNPGEKVLARSNTFNNLLMFTTFTPKTAQTNSCDAEPGIGRTYVLDMEKPYSVPYDPTNPDDIKYSTEFTLKSGGIPPMPIPVLPKKQDKKACDSDGNCKDLAITPPVLEDILVGTETLLDKDNRGGRDLILGGDEFDPIQHQYWYER